MCLDEDQIVLLLEGQLTDIARARVDAHLDVCSACRRLVAAAAEGDGSNERSAAEETAPLRGGARRFRRVEDALAPMEEALAFQEGEAGVPRELAAARLVVAQALWATGGDRARARRLAELAIEAYRAEGDTAREDLRAARAWLSALDAG
jgi:anti-sigma factor RsiW